MTKQQRGRSFERLLHELLDISGLNPRRNHRPKGEEVDGSFILDGHSFIFESKWHANPVQESQILAFRGKVEGKLQGTLGIFVSASGYSTDAVAALQKGKSLNVLLFDRFDVEDAVDHGFKRVLDHKMREAAEKGEVYANYRNGSTRSGPRRPQRQALPQCIVLLRDEREEKIAQKVLSELTPSGSPILLEFKGGVAPTEVVRSARYLTEEYNVLALYEKQSLPDGDVELLREMSCATFIDVPGGLNQLGSELSEESGFPSREALAARWPVLSEFLAVAQMEIDRLASINKQRRPTLE